MEELSTKDVCELLVFNNYKVLNIRKLLALGALVSIGAFVLFYTFFDMHFSSNLVVDYTINICLFLITYLLSTSVMLFMYIKRVYIFIELNIDILLFNVELENLEAAYKEALKQNITNNKLLTFLQSQSNKKNT